MDVKKAYAIFKKKTGLEPHTCFKHGQYYIFDCTPKGDDIVTTNYYAVQMINGKVIPYAPMGSGLKEFNKFVQSSRRKLQFK